MVTVPLQSFSFAAGYPADRAGHGGGSVFDCRCLANPGRLPHCAGLTGRNQPVCHELGAAAPIE
jgi:RNase adaptor protein for sRNA GlmZ degradation